MNNNKRTINSGSEESGTENNSGNNYLESLTQNLNISNSNSQPLFNDAADVDDDEIVEETLNDPRAADLYASFDSVDEDGPAPPPMLPASSGGEEESEPQSSLLLPPSTNNLVRNASAQSMAALAHHSSLPPLLPSEISLPGEYDWEGLDSAIGLTPAQPGNNNSNNNNNIYAGEHVGIQDATLTEIECAGYSLTEIVQEQKFRRRIIKDYQKFLTTFVDDQGISVYNARIREMCAQNGESLTVSYLHLVESNAFLAKLVANVPTDTLALFDEATMRIVIRLFEEYDKIKPEIHVRISDYPSHDNLRDLRYNHLGSLIRVTGVVTRRSGVFPQLKLVKFDCGKCGALLGPFVQDLNSEIKISNCSECGARGPFTVNATQTVYRNYQKLTLQESPGSVPAGRLPRHKDVILLWDLIDAARPGELVEVTGVYRNNFSYHLNSKNGFPVFSTIIEANHLLKSHDGTSMDRLTEEDQREIRKLAEDPHIALRLIKSIAPSIYGHQDIKTSIALALFGGQAKNAQGKHPIRGDINVLLLGDPGTAKSQFLKYVEKVAPRAVYATGQGASAVGLTASVRKDPITREWTLEGGALVLADKGVCLIDEFDKMNDSDRTSIHEAMEQQSISISKAGIITSLQARCSIIAAANPIRGRYNASLTFSQNVHLTEPILSRFDCLCVVQDKVNESNDERLARFVVGSHIRSHPDGDVEIADSLQSTDSIVNTNITPLDQDTFRKYLVYAKSRVRPELGQVDVDKISRLYGDLRRESLATGSIPITVRHIESMVRMAEAHARMHLRDHVRSDDIDMAIRVMLTSFISTQKYSVMSHLKRSFAKYITHRRDHIELLLFALEDLANERRRFMRSKREGAADGDGIIPPVEVDVADFQVRARELGIYDLKNFYGSRAFLQSGHVLDGHVIRKSGAHDNAAAAAVENAA